MAVDSGATTFATGAAGFIGTELVKVLVARGHRVFGLTPSMEAAERVRRAGAVPVMGDLLELGQRQDEAAADWVFHLPPPPTCGPRVTRRPACAAVRENRAVGVTIHVEDGARALVHLAEHGEAGGRYFLVNRDPIRMHEFAETFARLANRPLHVWRVPSVATWIVVGPVLADDLQAGAVFSNIRLRGIGFRFRYPTLEHGLRQVVGALHG